MSKTKMIIAIYSLGNGGGEKALVNMLNSLSSELYDIDLQLFEKKGINLQFVPQWVNILPPLFPNGILSSRQQLMAFVKQGKLRKACEKIRETIRNRERNDREKTFYVWKSLRYLCLKNEKEYDVVISGMHGLSTYYALDCLKGKKKIAWVHTDYSKIPRVDADLEYFQMADHVVTVSQHCHDVLQAAFPQLKNIIIRHNINCPQMIEKMSVKKKPEECFPDKYTCHIVSIGRLIHLKGFDMAINAACILKDKGFSFKWYFIGEGEEKAKLLEQASSKGVSEHVEFIGAIPNPYPYIKYADVLVQSSRYEGKSMVLDEAKILNTPIVATAYDSVWDQIEDKQNGLIVEMNEAGIAKGIARVLNDDMLSNSIVQNLKNNDGDQTILISEYNELFGV